MTCNGCGSPSTCFHVTDKDATPALELHYCLACVVPFSVGKPYEAAGRDFVAQSGAMESWLREHEDFMKRASSRTVASAAFIAGRKFERERGVS